MQGVLRFSIRPSLKLNMMQLVTYAMVSNTGIHSPTSDSFVI